MTPEDQVRIVLEKARVSLDAAAETIHLDVEAAAHDLHAARLLVSIALAVLGNEADAVVGD